MISQTGFLRSRNTRARRSSDRTAQPLMDSGEDRPTHDVLWVNFNLFIQGPDLHFRHGHAYMDIRTNRRTENHELGHRAFRDAVRSKFENPRKLGGQEIHIESGQGLQETVPLAKDSEAFGINMKIGRPNFWHHSRTSAF